MTKTKQKLLNLKLIIWLLVGIIIVILILLSSQISKNNKPTVNITEKDLNQKTSYKDLTDDDPVMGELTAPVTIVEFSDYQCPFCQRFYTNTLPLIEKEYIDKGLVKLVYRDFPLSNHEFAQISAEAAECAGEQDKYFEMQDKLFINGVEGGIESYKQFAEELNLDASKFNSCLDDREMKSEVLNDLKEGTIERVTGTPAFFINGEMVVGAQPFSVFKEVIDRKLAESQ